MQLVRHVRYRSCCRAVFQSAAGMVFLFAGIAAPFDLMFQDLPSDESDAVLMLESGVLDSLLWTALEPFYHRPLEVPAGELAQLSDIFPEYASAFPADRETLQQYRPWDAEAVKRFCHDYPLIKKCLPVLRFDFSEERSRGTAALFLYPGDSGREHSLRGSLTPGRKLQFEADVDLTESSARFRRRSLVYHPSALLQVRAGNTALFDDGGLFCGVFGKDSSSRTDITRNLAEGSAAAWNGVSCRVACPLPVKKLSAVSDLFMHLRTGESAEGILAGMEYGTGFKGEIGYLQNSQSANTDVAGFMIMRGTVHARDFTSSVIAGSPVRMPDRIPFIWENRYRTAERTFTVNVTGMPESLTIAQSRVLRRFRNEMEETGDSLGADVTLVQFSSSRSGQGFSIVPAAALWFSGRMVHHAQLAAAVRVKGSAANGSCRFTADVVKEPAGTNPVYLSRIDADAAITSLSHADMRFSATASFSESLFRYFRWSFTPLFTFVSGSTLNPTVGGVVRNDGVHEFILGCRHRQALFRNTFSELHAEKNIAGSATEGSVYVEGSAVFLF